MSLARAWSFAKRNWVYSLVVVSLIPVVWLVYTEIRGYRPDDLRYIRTPSACFAYLKGAPASLVVVPCEATP